MPEKIQTIYICSNCDAQFSKWNGRCLECGSWGTLKQQTLDQAQIKNLNKDIPAAEIINLKNIEDSKKERTKTGISEFDRVLGGGFVPGSVILLSGEPGIGKSTIVAQIAFEISKSDKESNVLYISGEESSIQIKNRFVRLSANSENISLITETNIEKIIKSISESTPSLIIVDSIQTVYTYSLDSEPGSLGQIRASAVKFLEIAKKQDIPVIIIGHITKDGMIAGPKSLEHIVDTVIYLESESANNYKILRSTKNRFGSVNELGIFEMTSKGFKEIKNPSSIFIGDQDQKITGSVISCIIEGTRPFLIELQALVTKTVFGYPQRKSSGYDLNRLQVLTAVLTKRANINLTNQDVILNIVGGMKINDPGLDLAACLAITSSLLNQEISRKTIVLGEVGLGGEIRNVSKIKERIVEAEKLGFNSAIIPDIEIKTKNVKCRKINNLEEIVKNL